jgi:hypothetical protein
MLTYFLRTPQPGGPKPEHIPFRALTTPVCATGQSIILPRTHPFSKAARIFLRRIAAAGSVSTVSRGFSHAPPESRLASP